MGVGVVFIVVMIEDLGVCVGIDIALLKLFDVMFSTLVVDIFESRGFRMDCFRRVLQLLEQVLTSSHTLSHFFLHVKGRLHVTQILAFLYTPLSQTVYSPPIPLMSLLLSLLLLLFLLSRFCLLCFCFCFCFFFPL